MEFEKFYQTNECFTEPDLWISGKKFEIYSNFWDFFFVQPNKHYH